MTAKLHFNGIEISVPVSELADALRQLNALSSTQPVAAKKLRPAWPIPTSAPQVQVSKGAVVDEVRAINFLTLLRDRKVTGVTAKEVQDVLGASHPKGVGSRMVAVNARLTGAGFAPEKVFSNDQRDPRTNGRIWQAGPKLEEALAKLEEL